MDLPNIPTDNLYKFQAIFGLILVGFSVYFILDISKNSLNAKKELANIEFKYYQDSLVYKGALENYNFFLELQSSLDLGDLSKEYIIERFKDIYEKRIEVNLRADSVNQTLFEQVKKKNDSRVLDYLADKNIIGLSLLLSYGVLLMLVGFQRWQVRYQKYIDAEVRYKGEKYVEKLKAREGRQKSQMLKCTENTEDRPKET